jgi:D-alanyl-D-alanine carboxypeptidase (penicillin-binding protein 5/6)
MRTKKVFKTITLIILAVFVVLTISQPIVNASSVDAKAALVVDARNGQILFDQNSTKRLPIASISKLLAVAVIVDEINHHQLSWNTKVKINSKLAQISTASGYANVTLIKGHSYTVSSLVHAALIKSADGAALALSTTNGDSVTQFNKRMIKLAKKMGITDALIYNPVGLKNADLLKLRVKGVAANAENKMTSRDIAKLAQYIINNDPELLYITGMSSAQFKVNKAVTSTMSTLNEMLPGQPYAPQNIQIDGLKTGTSDAAGQCFVGTGVYNGRRLITVVLHANSGASPRFTQTTNALKQAISNNQLLYMDSYIRSSNKLTKISVSAGTKTTTTLKLQNNSAYLWEPIAQRTNSIGKIKLNLNKASMDRKGNLKAPLHKNKVVGSVQVENRNLSFLDHRKFMSYKVITSHNVKRANIFIRITRAIF